MFYIWLLVIWLSPNLGCLLFVWVTPHPDVITALLGVLFGFAVSIMVFLGFNGEI